MKILLIIASLEQGGAERVMVELANSWSKQGHSVSFILLTNVDVFYELNEGIIVEKLRFENLGKFSKITSEIKTFFKLRSLIKKYNPDCIMSFILQYNIFTVLASRFLPFPVYISDRNNPLKKVSFLNELLRKVIYPFSDGIITQTVLSQKTLENKVIHKNIKVIPNPVKKIKEFDIKKEKIILNIGRLVPEKGQVYLLEAFSKLNLPDWKLVILGDGPLRASLELLAKELNITDKLYMPGSVTNIDEWLNKSSIFIFPSISEGFPNALLEAMSAGLPVISFDCDAGPRDIIENNVNGIIIELKDIDSLVENMYYLIDNEDKRSFLGNNAREVGEKFSLDVISKEYLDFITKNM